MNYTPKVGDKVRLTYEGRVTEAGDAVVRLNRWWLPLGGVSDAELIEPAREPFVVGQLLTEAMGQPPVGSVLMEPDDFFYIHGRKGWRSAQTGLNVRWESFLPNIRAGRLVLLHLGGAEC